MNPAKRLLGFKLLDLAKRLGFDVLEIDGSSEELSKRLLADILETLPKEMDSFQGQIPATLVTSFTE